MERIAHRLPVFMLIALCLVVCGCQSIPTEQLRAFSAQFAAAKDESAALQTKFKAQYGEYYNAIPGSTNKGLDRAGFPVLRLRVRLSEPRPDGSAELRLDDAAAAPDPLEVEADLAVREETWKLLQAYHDALLVIAGKEGSPEAAAMQLAESIGSWAIKAAGNSVPWIGPAVELGGTIVRLILDEVRAQRFRKAVVAADPLIAEIMEVLRQDIAMQWDMYRAWLREREVDPRYLGVHRLVGSIAEHKADAAVAEKQGIEKLIEDLEPRLKSLPLVGAGSHQQLVDTLRRGGPVGSGGGGTRNQVWFELQAGEINRLAREMAAQFELAEKYRNRLELHEAQLALLRASHSALVQAMRTDGDINMDEVRLVLDQATTVWRSLKRQEEK